MCTLLLYILGSKWSPSQKILVILQKCLEKIQKFWKSQGKIREFHVEKNVGTLPRLFRRELSVMHSLRLHCKFSCQNFLVHPKCTLGGSTKCHAFHLVLPTKPPLPPQKWKFQSRLDLENLKLASRLLKVGHQQHPSPPRHGNLRF